MNASKALFLALALSASVFVSGCGSSEASSDETQAATVTAIPVSTAPAQRGSIVARYTGTSVLEAHNEAPVVAKVKGDLTEIFVEEGDEVVAGQVLARLDGKRMKLDMEQAGAELRRVQQEYQRNQKLIELDLVSEDALESLQFDVEALRAAYQLARINYGYSEIKSPIDGVISERFVKLGNHVTTNQKLFQVTDPDRLMLEVYVPQREMRRFAVGQTADLFADALPDQIFGARVERISPRIDEETGTIRVTLYVNVQDGDTQSRSLRPGMFTRVAVVYDVHSDVIMVPLAAVVGEDLTTSLFVIEDGVAKRRTIETGIADRDMIEVINGINDDDKVVVVGQGGLKDGTNVSEHAG